jgi:peptidoglycan/LPS O-acetylase OafA/YrhL
MKLREIERLRAVAALLVVSVHWWPLHNMFPTILRDSWSGVDLFFVISGYVVSLSLMRLLGTMEGQPTFLQAFDAAGTSIKTFYVRRFFRIVPVALVVALSIRVLAGVHPETFGTTGDWLKEFVAFFGGIYNYAFGGQSMHMNVYWSLAVEEHFYLLLPLLFLLFVRLHRGWGRARASRR